MTKHTFVITASFSQQNLQTTTLGLRNNLKMLMIQRSAGVLPAIEDDHIAISQLCQRLPRSVEIALVQNLILRLEFYGMEHQLRSNNAVLIQDQFVARTKESETELFAVACKGGFALLGTGCSWFSDQAWGYAELKLGMYVSLGVTD